MVQLQNSIFARGKSYVYVMSYMSADYILVSSLVWLKSLNMRDDRQTSLLF